MNAIVLLFSLAWRNLWRNTRRTLVILFAIVLGAWAMIVMSAFARGISIQMFDDAIENLTGHIQVHAPHYLDDPVIDHRLSLDDVTLKNELASDAILAWSPRVRVPAVVASEYDSMGVVLLGIDPSREAELSFYGNSIVDGKGLVDTNDPGIVIGKKLAERLETSIGKRIVLMTQDKANQIADRGFRVVGIFDTPMDANETEFVFVALGNTQQLLAVGNSVSEIALLLRDDKKIDELAKRIRENLKDTDVATWSELEPMTKLMIELYDGYMIIWHLIIFVAMSFGIVNTLLMAVFERTREFGLFLALGLRPRFILLQVWLEAILLLIIGLAFGNVISWLSVLATGDGIDVSAFARGMEMAGLSNVIPFIIVQKDLIMANTVVVVLGMLTGLYPAWRASRLVPADAITRV